MDSTLRLLVLAFLWTMVGLELHHVLQDRFPPTCPRPRRAVNLKRRAGGVPAQQTTKGRGMWRKLPKSWKPKQVGLDRLDLEAAAEGKARQTLKHLDVGPAVLGRGKMRTDRAMDRGQCIAEVRSGRDQDRTVASFVVGRE